MSRACFWSLGIETGLFGVAANGNRAWIWIQDVHGSDEKFRTLTLDVAADLGLERTSLRIETGVDVVERGNRACFKKSNDAASLLCPRLSGASLFGRTFLQDVQCFEFSTWDLQGFEPVRACGVFERVVL